MPGVSVGGLFGTVTVTFKVCTADSLGTPSLLSSSEAVTVIVVEPSPFAVIVSVDPSSPREAIAIEGSPDLALYVSSSLSGSVK